MIEVKNVSKRYKNTNALDNVSFTLHAGQIVGLLGPNGSGKTTLIKILNGLLRDFDGEIKIDGMERSRLMEKILGLKPKP